MIKNLKFLATRTRLSLVSRIFLIRRNFIYSGAKPCPRHSPACQRALPALLRRANYRGRRTRGNARSPALSLSLSLPPFFPFLKRKHVNALSLDHFSSLYGETWNNPFALPRTNGERCFADNSSGERLLDGSCDGEEIRSSKISVI